MAKKTVFMVLFLVLGSLTLCFSQPSMGEIDKMQQDIEMDKTLRTEAEKGKKAYINKIIVKGITLLTEDEIKEITLPFKNHWLTEEDINLILDSISSAYKKKGYEGEPSGISFRIKKSLLEITVEELKH